MEDQVTITLVLTGPFAGKTMVLNGLRFVNGKCTVRDTPEAIGNVQAYFARCYEVYPEGTEELRKLQERDNGTVPSTQTTRQELENSDGPHAPEEILPDDGEGDVDPDAGVQRTPEQNRESIRAAVAQLDPDNEDHWTSSGKPQISVVCEISGIPSLTRKQIEEAAPGVVRNR